jgi:DNA-binding NarL/FixJ family response regulator
MLRFNYNEGANSALISSKEITKANYMKILIADDHAMFVDGIKSIIETETDMNVVGRCYNGKSVIEFIKNESVDIILLDVNLPDINGVEVCKEALKINPSLKVLAITMFNEESFIQEILNNGAKGYILKNTGRDELLKAIRTVSKGESYFSKEVTESIMKSLMNQRKASNKSVTEIPKISRREKEVLKLIIEEFTTQEIADSLYISLKTVESHRASLLSKLNARNTAGLVRIAIEHKLLETQGDQN